MGGIDNIAIINTELKPFTGDKFGIDVEVPTTLYAPTFAIDLDMKLKDGYRIIIFEDFPKAHKISTQFFFDFAAKSGLILCLKVVPMGSFPR